MTIAATLASGRSRLAGAGQEGASLDARVLLGHVTGLSREAMIIEEDRPLSQADREEFDTLVERRLAHEPVAYLIGKKEFHGLSFKVTPETLIPRPDTETLVETALDFCQRLDGSPRILDLGTGSGAILLALLHACREATGIGVDCSSGALEIARQNAMYHGLEGRADFIRGDWAKSINGPFDVIATNPPYITTGDMAGLMPDVARYEPAGALNGGADGLDPLRVIAPDALRLLSHQGLFLVEIGLGQAVGTEDILKRAGFQAIQSVPDLNGITRCITAQPPS